MLTSNKPEDLQEIVENQIYFQYEFDKYNL